MTMGPIFLDIFVMPQISFGMYAIMREGTIGNLAWRNTLTGITRRKLIKMTCGTNLFLHRQHRKCVKSWIRHGKATMPF
jgi:hypothetical protein